MTVMTVELAILAVSVGAVAFISALYVGNAIISATRATAILIDTWLHTWRGTQVATAECQRDAMIRAAEIHAGKPNADDQLRETCERALITLLQTNGGFPASVNNEIGRELVREIRKMYAELAQPTPAPVRQAPLDGPVGSVGDEWIGHDDEFAQLVDEEEL